MPIDSLLPIQNLVCDGMTESVPLLGSLASVDDSDIGRVRTVVIRQFDPQQMTISISADVRSAKVAHLARRPMAEVCLWFSESRIALRMLATWKIFRGDSQDAQHNERLQRFWEAHSAASKTLFLGPAPGDRCTPTVIDEIPVRFPATFAEIAGHIEEIDALEIRRGRHLRWHHTRQSQATWESTELNP